MTTNSGGDGTPYEIEVSLNNGADLELTHVDVNTDGDLPLSFEVKGVITEENGTLDSLRGMALSPKAVRFEVTDQ